MTESQGRRASSGDTVSVGPITNLLRRVGSVVEVEVAGPSMKPAITEGSSVRIRCGSSMQFVPGDVIAFLAGGVALTIHRVVSSTASSSFLLTRGDDNLFCDPPLPVADVVGVVIRTEVTGEWAPVAECDPLQGFLGYARSVNEALMIRALALHVRLAQLVALISLVAVAPKAITTVWVHGRSASALRMFRLSRDGQ